MEETRNAPYFNVEDRISGLPDELIHYIMSFIDTKYAVQTSVLSKRWIHIWKSLPFLNFDRTSFSEDNKDSFMKFVDMVLIFRSQDFDIQKFNMLWEKSGHDINVTTNVNRWSLQAVRYNVQQVSIEIFECHDSAYEICQHLLNCKSLTKLVILVSGNDKYADIILPNSMCLPRLKVLSLYRLSISIVESFKTLFSSCPVLETLDLVDCDIKTDNQRNLVVDSPSLKTFLYDHRNKYLLLQNDTMANVIKLCAPNLATFTWKCFFEQDYSLENCSPLSRASLLMRYRQRQKYQNAKTYSKLPSSEKNVYAQRMMKSLGAVYMVKELQLSSGFLEVLSEAADLLECQPPHLPNLRILDTEIWSTSGCLRSIAYLLKISPNVTELSVKFKESNLADVGDGWEAGLSSPGMFSHLEIIRIRDVGECNNELKFLSFILKNAVVLKKLALYPCSTVDSPGGRVREKFRDKLTALPRASSRIKITWGATESTYLMK